MNELIKQIQEPETTIEMYHIHCLPHPFCVSGFPQLKELSGTSGLQSLEL